MVRHENSARERATLGPVETPQQRMARLGAGIDRLNAESAERAAKAGPGESLRLALELSELVRRSRSNFDKPLPPSLPALFRKLQRERER